MDFDPSEEQSIALDAFRRFVEAEIAPAVQTWRDATIPKDLAHALLRKLAAIPASGTRQNVATTTNPSFIGTFPQRPPLILRSARSIQGAGRG